MINGGARIDLFKLCSSQPQFLGNELVILFAELVVIVAGLHLGERFFSRQLVGENQRRKVGDALVVANEILAAAAKYPNHRDNDDERRQLKSEIYRSLVTRGIDGAQMVRLGDAVLRLLRG